MKSSIRCPAVLAAFCVGCVVVGCKKPAEPAATPRSSNLAPKPGDAPTHVAKGTDGSDRPAHTEGHASEKRPSNPNAGRTLTLTGVTMTVPDGWVAEPVQPGPFAAKAAFKLPKVEADSEDCTVRVTYFPNMKGMDERNIARWIGQIKKPDGTPFSRNEVDVVTSEMGHVRLKVLDMTGILSAGMRGTSPGLPDHRMIAAVVDHPRGPHFVKATGGAASMARWAPSIHAFLESARSQ